jgi:hypothetical protein
LRLGLAVMWYSNARLAHSGRGGPERLCVGARWGGLCIIKIRLRRGGKAVTGVCVPQQHACCMLHAEVACCGCVLQLRAVGSSAAFCAPITCLLEKTASSCVMSSHSVVRNIVRTIAKNIHA